MRPGYWYRISGNAPDLGLEATPPGTRYMEDGDPATDPDLNPPRSLRERMRRLAGRPWLAPWSGSMRFCGHTEAWNSAIYASGLGTSGSMVLFGGGHNCYFGSDAHAFDLESRQWRRLTAGFVAGGPSDYGAGAVYPDAVYPDGSPLPPHNYGYLQYDPAGNDLLIAKGQTELGPDVRVVAIPHLLNLDTLAWRQGPRHEDAILNSGGCATWDWKRRILWVHSGDDGGGNAFIGYNPDPVHGGSTRGNWLDRHPNKLPGQANHNAMQYEPATDQIVLAAHACDSFVSLEPGDPDLPVRSVTSLGNRPRIKPYPALEYSQLLGALVYYSADDGAAVFSVRYDGEARWRRVSSTDALDPVADAAERSAHPVSRSHTFGRFRVAEFAGCELAILVRHVDSPVYCLRLPVDWPSIDA